MASHLPRRRRHRARTGRDGPRRAWWLSPADVRSLDRYEGAPSNHRRRLVEVETAGARLTAMTYVMTRRDYLGLPSRWYLDRIETGFEEWGLPRAELTRALREARAELGARGIERYRRDGRKRLRAVLAGDAEPG